MGGLGAGTTSHNALLIQPILKKDKNQKLKDKARRDKITSPGGHQIRYAQQALYKTSEIEVADQQNKNRDLEEYDEFQEDECEDDEMKDEKMQTTLNMLTHETRHNPIYNQYPQKFINGNTKVLA